MADNAKPKTLNEDTKDSFSYPPYIRNITFFSFSFFFSSQDLLFFSQCWKRSRVQISSLLTKKTRINSLLMRGRPQVVQVAPENILRVYYIYINIVNILYIPVRSTLTQQACVWLVWFQPHSLHLRPFK